MGSTNHSDLAETTDADWGSLEAELSKVPPSDELSDADREILARFDRKMDIIKAKADRFDDSYQESLMYWCRQLAIEVGGLADTLEEDATGRKAVNEMVLWLDDQDLSGYAMESCLSSLRVFGHLMLDYTPDAEFDEEELPKRFREIDPGKYTRDLDPTPLPSEIVTYEEAIQMAKAQDNPRDAALIIVQWSAGLRPMCELHQLRYKHVEDKGGRYVITVPESGKTGSRPVHIYAGAPLLRQWLEQEHPAHLETEPDMNPETPLWTHHNKNKPIVYDSLSDVFDRAADRAGISKPNTPQHFRRSSASFFAKRTATDERHLRDRFGWSKLSDAPEHYIARFSEAQALKTAKIQGHEIDEEEDEQPVSPVHCESCEGWTTRGFEYCIWCRHPIGEEVQTLTESIEHPHKDGADLLEMIMNGEVDAEDLRAAKTLEPVIKTRAGFWEDMDDLIKLAEQYQDEEDQSPVAAGPGGVIAWASAWISRAVTRWAAIRDSVFRLHPEIEYPPDRRTAAKILTAQALVLGTIWLFFFPQELAAEAASGDPMSIVSLLAATGLGAVWIDREVPDVADLRDDL